MRTDATLLRPLLRPRRTGTTINVPVGHQEGPRARFRIQDLAIWPVPPGTWFLNPWGYAQRTPQNGEPARLHEGLAWTYMDTLEPLEATP